MSPILAFVVQSLIEHVHNLVKVARAKIVSTSREQFVLCISLVEGQSCDLSHVRAGRTPGVIGSSYLSLTYAPYRTIGTGYNFGL